MSEKKKNSKSVVIAIIITLIVLGCLTFAGLRFFNASDEDSQVKIYEFAVKVFPLLVGIVLIVIASMIATSREEEEDEEDKLPPNSYDQQLFEAPADDPATKTASMQVASEETSAKDEVAPEEAAEFYSIFDTPEDIVKKEEETEPDVEPEAVAQPQASKVEPRATVVATSASPLEKPLIEAIYTLVNKLNDVTDYLSYEEEDEEDEDDLDDYEYCDTDQDQEPYEEEEPVSTTVSSPLENKIDKLCDAIANLTAIVSAQAVAPAAAPAPAKPVEKKEAQKAAPAPAPAPVIQRVEVPVEVPVDQEINDVDVTDPIQRARIEFDSAKDGEYDISFVYTNADVDNVLASLGGTGDAFEINGKTVAIIPFLTGAEAKDELDKIGIDYDIQTIDADAITSADFDRDIAPRL
ncbi:MAG: hypothetical protein ILP16_02620 [Spirochaetales bacterium]|nr:hypothetical protein [Spirochaetales bacterium]